MGMNPLAAFPIMMGSWAPLQPWAGIKFVKEKAYHPKAAIALLTAYVVKSLPLKILKGMVVVVILYTSVMMFRSIGKGKAAPAVR